MLKMILADDEPMITKGLQLLFDWAEFGIEIIGIYEDGESALHAILEEEPDFAILDVSMPKKTGMEIISSLAKMESQTKVIFLSGFQEFHYVQDAIHHGAIGYLLKPVKKEELLQLIKKFVQQTHTTTLPMNYNNDKFLEQDDIKKLNALEGNGYIIVTVALWNESENCDDSLILFVAQAAMKTYLKNKNAIFLQRNHIPCIIFKSQELNGIKELLNELELEILEQARCKSGFVISEGISELADLQGKFEVCESRMKYFYFANLLSNTIIEEEEKIFENLESMERLGELRNKIIDKVFAQDMEATKNYVVEYVKLSGRLADGNKETAIYFVVTCINAIDEEIKKRAYSQTLLIHGNKLWEELYSLKYYGLFDEVVYERIQDLQEYVVTVAQGSRKGDIVKVIAYIKEHYRENLSLAILAEHIHMNSFYFSTYFKKQTGHNFKDYINQVRMEKALELLMCTDYKSYAIAEKVGYKDYRYFNEVFSRYYGKTPTAYRKIMTQNLEDIEKKDDK